MFLKGIGSLLPQHGKPKRAASSQTPNLASVVLHLEFASFAVLLGADMEVHHDPRRGWTAAFEEARDRGIKPASVFKVAHHGSVNGHHEGVWAQMLSTRPMAAITPFNRLPAEKKLPTQADLERLASLSSRVFVTMPVRGGSVMRGRDPAVVRGLRESGIEVRDVAAPLGAVRLRRRVGDETGWHVELFGPAFEFPATRLGNEASALGLG